MSKNNNGESLISGILKFSISSWVNLIVGFLSVLITTRIIAPETYGIISIFLSSVNVLLYVVTIGMDGAFIRFYNEPPLGNTKNQLIYKCLFISSAICILAGCICVIFFYRNISYYVFDISSQVLVAMMFFYTFCQVIFRYLNISFRMGFKIRQYTIQNILMSNLMRLLIILAALFTKDVVLILCVMTVGNAITMIVYLQVQKEEIIPYTIDNRVNFSISLKNFSEFFRFALFSAPTYIVTYLNTFLAQQIILNYLGAHALGVFSSTGMFSSILGAVKTGFSTYWAAFVYKNFETEKQRITVVHDYIVLFAIAISSCMVLFRDVIYIFIGTSYHGSKEFFSLILIMPVLSLVMETTDKGIAIEKKNHFTLISHAITVMVNIVMCYILIPRIGLIGVAYASAISGIVLFLMNTIIGQILYPSISKYIKSAVGFFVIITILIVPSVVNNYFFALAIIGFIDIFIIVLYRIEVKNIFVFILREIMHKK